MKPRNLIVWMRRVCALLTTVTCLSNVAAEPAQNKRVAVRPGRACSSETLLHLPVGGAREVKVYAHRPLNCSGLLVHTGEIYAIEAPRGAHWVDLIISSGPEGYSNAYQRHFDSWKRVPAAE